MRASRARVLLDGVDISRMVRGLEIRAEVGSVVTTHLEIIVAPTVNQGDDGVLEIAFATSDSPRLASAADTLPVRGITLRAE